MENNLTYHLIELLIVAMTSIIASSGFWLFVEKKAQTKDLGKKLLIGLAHDRIIYLSLLYIDRGSITQDEYENLCLFLYQPYVEIGGNGSIKRLMTEVDKLPIVNKSITEQIRSVKNVS